MKKKVGLILAGLYLSLSALYGQIWPVSSPEAKAGTRWWWLGSAVDYPNLKWNLEEYARTGIGAVEITPLYGVQGNESNELSFLSPKWMEVLKNVQDIAADNGIEVDMNMGTGWPFGGPEVPIEEAACKAIFLDSIVSGTKADAEKTVFAVPQKEKDYATLQCVKAFPTGKLNQWRVIAVYASRTRQKVKRAAPGGEGWVIDHFDRDAVRHYLDRFDRAFASSGVSYPHTFFNDSYEVYHANWTPTLFKEFARRRGYRLEDHLPELLGYIDDGNKVLSDYRETLSDLLYENFTQQWVEWAHQRGVKVRNQAHGSPANLLDLYAEVDIPEIEGFGLSEFGIRGLRTDPGMTRKNFSDVSMLKYASSAAHVTGKRLTSSETFTWLTEHFRTSLSQMKPDLDLMFTCGVNHVYFHGTCYSPKDDIWPGWKFYASVDMSPTNSIWHDASYLMKYIERCQSFLQSGNPDNDFLVYLPVRDMWKQRIPQKENGKGTDSNLHNGNDLLMQFDIHSMDANAPDFIRSILTIDSLGYDCDYISDRQLARVRMDNGAIVTEGGARYKALIIPTGTTMTSQLDSLLLPLTPYVIYGEKADEMAMRAKPEAMRAVCGLRAIRRSNEKGHFYFIVNLTPQDIDAWVPLTVEAKTASFYQPMDGSVALAEMRDGRVHMQLRSGESVILQVEGHAGQISMTENMMAMSFNGTDKGAVAEDVIDLTSQPWQLSFKESAPQVLNSFQLDRLQSWETLDDDSAKVTMATGVYTTSVVMNKRQAAKNWSIDLGDVRESARVYVNDNFVGCAWAVPFVLDCKNLFHKGKNKLRIEVTNLPANRIAHLDRKGYQWRKFKEINVVDINYKKTDYSCWEPMPSGLNSSVRLIHSVK